MVMDAVMVMEGPGGSRRVPISDFFKGPGESCMDSTEILGRIDIPEPEPGTGTAFVKIGRVAQDIAIANAAALIVMDNNVCRKCRLAAGAVAPVPLRLRKAEAAAEGEEITPDLLEEIGRIAETEVNPITDVRSTAEYRRAVSGVLIRRAMQWALKNRP
jgi:carbon-monoxide dehydrogenase medium subunit